MNERIENAKNEFLQAKAGLLQALSNTPDDRLVWSPSPTARSPLHQVVHAADSIAHIHAFLDGRPFEPPTPEVADRFFREREVRFARRDEAVELMERNAATFVSWLEALEPAQLDSLVETPFGMGKVPVGIGIGFPAMHTRWHHAQLDYIQTVYGDVDWRLKPSA